LFNGAHNVALRAVALDPKILAYGRRWSQCHALTEPLQSPNSMWDDTLLPTLVKECGSEVSGSKIDHAAIE
jgi:hypothetical protein